MATSARFSASSRCGTSFQSAWIHHLKAFASSVSGSRKPCTTADMPWCGVKVTRVMPLVVMVR